MFKHHSEGGGRPIRKSAIASAVQRVAPASLSLPALAENVPAGFVISCTDGNGLADAAATLADAGILLPEHWKGDVRSAVSAAISGVAVRARPKGLAIFDVSFVDDVVEADLQYNHSRSDYEERHNGKAGALIVKHTMNDEGAFHAVIGPQLKRLEEHCPGLGHAILRVITTAFEKSARACDPVTAFGWAQGNYWMGEPDESMVLEEQMDDLKSYHEEQQKKLPPEKRKPFSREDAIKELGLFTAADYNKAIPVWAGSGHFNHKKTIPARRLSKLRVARKYRPLIKAALDAWKLINSTPRAPLMHETGDFELVRWEMTPYILRWHCPGNREGQDPIAMIYDDFMNQEYQAGETQLEVNTVFAFHDSDSLVDAVRRFETWCQMLHAAENLLRALGYTSR